MDIVVEVTLFCIVVLLFSIVVLLFSILDIERELQETRDVTCMCKGKLLRFECVPSIGDSLMLDDDLCTIERVTWVWNNDLDKYIQNFGISVKFK